MAADDWVDAPPSATWGDTANDFAGSVANAATFGMAARAKAGIEYLKGSAPSYDEALEKVNAQRERSRERSPAASIAGDVYGSFAIPALGAENLALRTGAALAPTIGRAASAVGRAIGYGTTGAVTGAAQGAGSTYTGNPSDYLENAGWGAAINAPLGAVGGAVFGRSPARPSAVAPSAAELEASKNMVYRQLEQHPAQYTPDSFAQRADDVTAALRARNAHETTSPQSFRTVDQMYAPPTAVAAGRSHVTPGDVDFVRKGVTGDQIAGATPTDMGSARVVRRGIDDFVRNPPPGAAVPGTEHLAADAARVADTAHQLHGGFKRTQALEELISNAERQAGSTYSGLNLQNTLRQGVKAGLKEKQGTSPFSKAGYNDAERAALDAFTRGSRTNNALRYLDKFLGGGGGLGASVTAIGAPVVGGAGGYLKDNPVEGALAGGGAAGLGFGLRALGNRRASASIREIRDLIAQRNPLYAQRVARAPMVPGRGSPATAEAIRDAVATAIIKQRQRPEGADQWE